MRLRSALFSISVAALMASGSIGETQNLVVNGDFNQNVTGWMQSSTAMEISWHQTDCCGEDSGSALLSNVAEDLHFGSCTQCVTNGIVTGREYVLRALVRIPTGQTTSGAAKITVAWYTEPACTSPQISGPTSNIVYLSDEWVRLQSPELIAPAGAQSIRISLSNGKYAGGPAFDPHETYFDRVFLASAEVFTDGFESGNTSQWSVSVP